MSQLINDIDAIGETTIRDPMESYNNQVIVQRPLQPHRSPQKEYKHLKDQRHEHKVYTLEKEDEYRVLLPQELLRLRDAQHKLMMSDKLWFKILSYLEVSHHNYLCGLNRKEMTRIQRFIDWQLVKAIQTQKKSKARTTKDKIKEIIHEVSEENESEGPYKDQLEKEISKFKLDWRDKRDQDDKEVE